MAGGLRSGISEYGQKAEHVVVAENVEFRPYRAASVRKGTQRACAVDITHEPHTLMEWVAEDGTSKKFVACKGNPNGYLYRMAPGALTPQSIAGTSPILLLPNTKLSYDQLDGGIFATENGGTQHPFFYRSDNAVEQWLDCVFPTPAGTLTLTPGVTAGGGLVASKYYSYRLRHLFAYGSSPPSPSQEVVLGGADNFVAVSTIPVNPSGRTDYLGWVLERTQGYASPGYLADGPFYFVASGVATNRDDLFADADLGYFSNDLWYGGIPNGHLDGIFAMPDRLLGWQGSTVYCSQPIGHDSGAGILNWNAKEAYDFGADDGGTIQTLVRQGDRVAVLKNTGFSFLEGNDPTNFTIVPHTSGVGASGLRCAASIGQTVMFYGPAGLHRIVGNDLRPFGYVEVGDVLESFSPSRLQDVVVRAHRGQRFLIGYSAPGTLANSDVLVYDERFRTWEKWPDLRAQDILIPKVSDFGDNEAFLFADTNDFDIGTPHVGDYRVWIGNYGTKDEKNYAGGAGSDIVVTLRTPWIDDGMPDIEKVYELLQVYAGGADATMVAYLETDPASGTIQVPLTLPATGKLWGTFVFGDGTVWGKRSEEASSEAGAPIGVRGRRYRITFVASVPNDFVFKGYALRAIYQPGRRYSR